MSNKGYRGLGRGLETLLNVPRATVSNLSPLENVAMTGMQLPVTVMVSGRFQPRTKFDEEQIETLAQSIQAQGVVQPIVVRQLSDGQGNRQNQYEIIAGERRWRAAKKAGLESIPVVIRNDIDDKQSMAIALIENIQREDLNVIEEAEGLKRLNSEFALTHEEISRIVGKSRSAITNALRLLELSSQVQDMVREDKLKMGHARALLSLPEEQQISLAEETHKRHLTAREVEKLVNDTLQGGQNIKRSVQLSDEQKTLAKVLQHQLIQVLNTPVQVKYKANGQGSVNINFKDISEVQSLIEKLNP